MSDTPRTDNAFNQMACFGSHPAVECLLHLCRELERALARYESAKMPEEPGYFRTWLLGHAKKEDVEYIDKLRTFAAAATVRAEEARRKAIEECAKVCQKLAAEYSSRGEELRVRGPITFEAEIDRWFCRANQSTRDADAIRALQAGGKE